MRKPFIATLGAFLFLTFLAMPSLTSGAEEKVAGHQLMTQEEMQQHHEQMQNATAEERDQLRAKHREEMMKRAEEKGVTLDCDMPMDCPGMSMEPDSKVGKGHDMGKGKMGGMR